MSAAAKYEPLIGEPQQVAVDLPPLPEIQPETEYPLHALGGLLGDAARTIADVVQLPPAIAAQSVLAAASMVAQQFANVEIDGRTSPLSLFCLTVAKSGARKSSADSIAKKPLDDWQRNLIEQHREAQQDYRNDFDAYKNERDTILKDKKSTRADIKTKLAYATPPIPPIKPYVFCQEPTLEGLQKGFVGGYPSQGLFTDEGGQFFGGHAMNKDNALKTIAGLSKFWDGSPIIRTRAGDGESAALYNRRLSIHIMVQPFVAALVLSDSMLQQQGILARFLIAQPRSMAGERPYNGRDATLEIAINRYWQRMAELLARPAEVDAEGGIVFTTLRPSGAAKSLWVDCYNEIEANLKGDKPLSVIEATAAKMADNVLRIAGVLAVFDDAEEINEAHMASAIQLGNFYLSEQLRLAQHADMDTTTQHAVDAEEWIKSKGGVVTIETLQKGPRNIRKSVNHIRDIMALLVAHGRCEITEYNSKNDPSAWRLSHV